MRISKLLKMVPLLGLLALGACSGGGDDGPGQGPPTPITTTNYTADFSPTHVIDAAAAPATVSATASLSTASGDDITASGTVTVSGTTATTVTINVGYAGENGPIAVTLNDAGGGDWVVPSGTALDITALRILDSTGYYVRIQSPDGELRGQILPPGWAVGTISLDAASVVPGSTSLGTAKAGFALNPAIGTYYARVHSQSGASGQVTQFYQLDLTAESVVPSLLGDFNDDGLVDAADYTVWRDTLGQSVDLYSGADHDGNGLVDAGDYSVWQNNFGASAPGFASAVPEPQAILMLFGAIFSGIVRKNRR